MVEMHETFFGTFFSQNIECLHLFSYFLYKKNSIAHFRTRKYVSQFFFFFTFLSKFIYEKNFSEQNLVLFHFCFLFQFEQKKYKKDLILFTFISV